MYHPHRDRLIEAIRSHKLHLRSTAIANILSAAESGALSELQCFGHLQQLQGPILAQEIRPNTLPEPPPEDVLYADGRPDIELGTLADTDGLRFGVRCPDRPRHKLIIGATGSGKSTLQRHLIQQYYQLCRERGLHISMIVADRKASEYAGLVELGPEWSRFDWQNGLRVGLNAPPGLPPNIWINLVSTSFAARAGLVAAAAAFNDLLRWSLSVLNPTPGTALRWPSLRLLAEIVGALPEEAVADKGIYAQSLRRALREISQSSEVFDTFAGLDLERDVIAPGRHAVIDLANLSPPFARLFLIDLLLAQVLYGRLQAGHRVDTTEVIFFLDEADVDISGAAERQFADGVGPLGQTLKQGRELGIQVVLGASFIGDISRLIRNNIQDYFVFNLSDPDSVVEAHRTLMLP
jgi:hypothetical protein